MNNGMFDYNYTTKSTIYARITSSVVSYCLYLLSIAFYVTEQHTISVVLAVSAIIFWRKINLHLVHIFYHPKEKRLFFHFAYFTPWLRVNPECTSRFCKICDLELRPLEVPSIISPIFILMLFVFGVIASSNTIDFHVLHNYFWLLTFPLTVLIDRYICQFSFT